MNDAALILGASDVFPLLGSSLPSCCTDIRNMFNWYGANYPMAGAPFIAFQNARFTKKNFFDAARKLLRSGIKRCVIDLSSHGTVIPKNGANHAAIVFANSTWDDLETFGFDDDFAALFYDFPSTRFFMAADACESADLGRRMVAPLGLNKFIDPPDDLQMMIDHNQRSGVGVRAVVPVTPNVAYISGTGGQGFYSMDEGDGGAFSKAFAKVARPGLTAREIATECDKVLDPSQQPQAHGGLVDEKWFT